MLTALRLTLLALTGSLALPASADLVTYTFTGTYFGTARPQAYTGSFVVDNPALTSVRPPMAPDVTGPGYAGVWEGRSDAYTGAGQLEVVFASGTRMTAGGLYTVVNNTTFAGTGTPYPEGLSVQFYLDNSFALFAPTGEVCDTSDGTCGADDDPIYDDATQAELMQTSGLYLAFWGGALSTTPGMPLLTEAGLSGGLGFYRPNEFGFTTTTLTSLTGLSAEVTATPGTPPDVGPAPVSEPTTPVLVALGVIALLTPRRRRA